MSNQTQILIEKTAIIDVVNRLFISTDNRDWAKVKTCFADAVLFDMTSMTGGEPVTMTAQQIVEGWDSGLKALKAIHHQVGNFVVDLQDNEAEVFCYGLALHYLPNPTNQNTRSFVGSYNLHLTKAGGSWRVDGFKFNLKFMDGNLHLENSFGDS